MRGPDSGGRRSRHRPPRRCGRGWARRAGRCGGHPVEQDYGLRRERVGEDAVRIGHELCVFEFVPRPHHLVFGALFGVGGVHLGDHVRLCHLLLTPSRTFSSQALTAFLSECPLLISILRGLAFSATGIVNRSTPAS